MNSTSIWARICRHLQQLSRNFQKIKVRVIFSAKKANFFDITVRTIGMPSVFARQPFLLLEKLGKVTVTGAFLTSNKKYILLVKRADLSTMHLGTREKPQEALIIFFGHHLFQNLYIELFRKMKLSLRNKTINLPYAEFGAFYWSKDIVTMSGVVSCDHGHLAPYLSRCSQIFKQTLKWSVNSSGTSCVCMTDRDHLWFRLMPSKSTMFVVQYDNGK